MWNTFNMDVKLLLFVAQVWRSMSCARMVVPVTTPATHTGAHVATASRGRTASVTLTSAPLPPARTAPPARTWSASTSARVPQDFRGWTVSLTSTSARTSRAWTAGPVTTSSTPTPAPARRARWDCCVRRMRTIVCLTRRVTMAGRVWTKWEATSACVCQALWAHTARETSTNACQTLAAPWEPRTACSSSTPSAATASQGGQVGEGYDNSMISLSIV